MMPVAVAALNLGWAAVMCGGIWLAEKIRGRKLSWLVILGLVTLLPVWNIFRNGTYQSGDLTFHAVFATAYAQAWRDGVVIPRWAGGINFGFGSALFIFTYPLPYAAAALVKIISGLPMLTSIKWELAAVFGLAGMGMYWWARKHLSAGPAAVAAVLYLFAPYHLIDLHYRVALGELWAMMWLPLVLGLMWKYQERGKFIWASGAGAALAGMILSHQAVSLVAVPFIAAYSWMLKKNTRRTVVPLVLGLALAAWYWIPVLYEAQFTHQAAYAGSVEFQKLSDYIFSPYEWGFLWEGHRGELVNLVGYVQLILAGIGIWGGLTGKIKARAELGFLLAWAAIYFGLMQEPAKIIWNLLPILKNLQFAYRMMAVESLVVAAIGGLVVQTLGGKWKTAAARGIIAAAVVSSVLNWAPRKFLPALSDAQLEQSGPSIFLFDPYPMAATVWSDIRRPFAAAAPAAPAEVIAGKAVVENELRNSVRHEYRIRAETAAVIKENTDYFPGWKLWVDGREKAMDYQNPNFPGVISFGVGPGEHTVRLEFGSTPDREIAGGISLATLGVAGVVLLFTSRSGNSRMVK